MAGSPPKGAGEYAARFGMIIAVGVAIPIATHFFVHQWGFVNSLFVSLLISVIGLLIGMTIDIRSFKNRFLNDVNVLELRRDTDRTLLAIQHDIYALPESFFAVVKRFIDRDLNIAESRLTDLLSRGRMTVEQSIENAEVMLSFAEEEGGLIRAVHFLDRDNVLANATFQEFLERVDQYVQRGRIHVRRLMISGRDSEMNAQMQDFLSVHLNSGYEARVFNAARYLRGLQAHGISPSMTELDFGIYGNRMVYITNESTEETLTGDLVFSSEEVVKFQKFFDSCWSSSSAVTADEIVGGQRRASSVRDFIRSLATEV